MNFTYGASVNCCPKIFARFVLFCRWTWTPGYINHPTSIIFSKKTSRTKGRTIKSTKLFINVHGIMHNFLNGSNRVKFYPIWFKFYIVFFIGSEKLWHDVAEIVSRVTKYRALNSKCKLHFRWPKQQVIQTSVHYIL